MTIISLPFAIGQTVWVPTFSTSKTLVPCPECGGTKVVRVTNNAGQVATVDCEHCKLDGWKPHGSVWAESGKWEPVQRKLTKLVRYEDGRAEYRVEGDDTNPSCWTSYYSDNMYADFEPCAAVCAKNAAKAAKDEAERILRSLSNSRSKAVRTVRWHKRKIAELKKQLAVVVKRLNEMETP